MIEKYPEEMIYRSIWGMIPHNRLGRKMIKKLHIYKGSEHKHEAQQPQVLEIK
jgi:large subunit ribosomal protein L13